MEIYKVLEPYPKVRSLDAHSWTRPARDTNILEFFKETEFDCKCGGTGCHGVPEAGMDKALLAILGTIRTLYGEPLGVTSGYRCPVHNKSCGGTSSSSHMQARAADIHPKFGKTESWESRVKRVAELHSLVTKVMRGVIKLEYAELSALFFDEAGRGKIYGRRIIYGGIGLYPGKFVHVDTRRTGSRLATWTG